MTSQELIIATANKYGVDSELALQVAKQESGFSQTAKSPVGAIGMFQLMPGTAKDMGVDPYSLEGNITGGIKYLRQQLDRFGGDTSLALAAYNAGPGNVIKYGGIPPFKETQDYVAKILGRMGFLSGHLLKYKIIMKLSTQQKIA